MKIYKSNKRREGCGKARFFDGTHSSPKYTTNINFNSIKMKRNYARTLLHLLDCNIKITQLHMVLKSFSPFFPSLFVAPAHVKNSFFFFFSILTSRKNVFAFTVNGACLHVLSPSQFHDLEWTTQALCDLWTSPYPRVFIFLWLKIQTSKQQTMDQEIRNLKELKKAERNFRANCCKRENNAISCFRERRKARLFTCTQGRKNSHLKPIVMMNYEKL